VSVPRIQIAGKSYRVPDYEPARTIELYWLLGVLVAENKRQFQTGAAKLVPVTRFCRYRREPAGREHWQTAAEMQASRLADCEDLSGYEGARLQVIGLHRVTVDLETTSLGWHVVCKLPDGRVYDPSIACGMGRDMRDDER
jgi:hypothetical protein